MIDKTIRLFCLLLFFFKKNIIFFSLMPKSPHLAFSFNRLYAIIFYSYKWRFYYTYTVIISLSQQPTFHQMKRYE